MGKLRCRRILAAALCAALLLSGQALAASYGDMSGHWAEAAVDRWSTLGIVQGDDQGNFRPDDTISRAELAAILNRYMKYTEQAENTYADLPEDAWYTEDILCLAEAGLMLGDGEYQRPNDPVTRQEAAVLFARAFGLAEGSGSLSYPDSASIASWARGYVSAMTAAGYLQGDDAGRFRPTDPLTRCQTVTILNNWGKIRVYGRFLDVKEDVPEIPYSAWDFTTLANGRVSYESEEYTAVTGVDVSFWQGDIDWQAVAADGIDFAFIRLGNRWSTDGHLEIDSCFAANIQGAQAAGLDVGVYFFSQALTEEEAVEEAEFVLEALEGYNLELPVVFDWEPISGEESRTGNMDYSVLDDLAIAFCDRVAADGYEPMIYFNQYFGYLYYDLSRLTDYGFWYAGYFSSNTPNFYYAFDIWQYTSSGSVSGIAGNADLNLMFLEK